MSDENKLLGKQANGLIKAPTKAWIHSDQSLHDGISYKVKYIGCIGINESMKSLSFEIRTQVARESIRRVAESAKLLNLPRRSKKNDDNINKILSNSCLTQWSGMNVQLHINTQLLRITQLECNDVLFQHTMQNISFACGGDSDIQDFVAYVAKDDVNGRACYVFECVDNMANSVITTIGQAFELRFRKFLNSMPSMKASVGAPHAEQTPVPTVKRMAESFATPVSAGVASTPASAPYGSKIISSGASAHAVTPGAKASKMDERLERMAWFHGLMTRENAEKLLVKDGDYLVRETNKAERQYVLSGRYKGECRHIFLVDPSGVVRTKDRVFDNICHLIQYHQDNNIPIISKENELLLEHPVCK
ncbi:SHC-transforming 4 [Brachionus plicatilis]|uniref:SHC-transforming 4 n=1 Tax=Brachionus plicatilis TaxID=10195 RepID=A0A3M7QEN7_BRAPC|nr:SHC-transforming 4 [Brachionus plicatilis]